MRACLPLPLPPNSFLYGMKFKYSYFNNKLLPNKEIKTLLKPWYFRFSLLQRKITLINLKKKVYINWNTTYTSDNYNNKKLEYHEKRKYNS